MLLRKNKKVKRLIILGIVLILISVWWFSSLILNSYTGLSALKYEFKLNEDGGQYLYKNKKIKGEFVSPQNNLGIVDVHFSRYVKPDFELEDEIIFRLKEKGKNRWLYEQRYHSGLMEGYEIFPFGFPIINNSKDKVYVFEIESLKGNKVNAVKISKNPEFFTEHVFLLSNIKQNLPSYLVQKTLNSIFSVNYLMSSAVFLMPLMLFILFSSFFNKNKHVEKYLPTITLALMVADIFIIPEYAVGITLVLVSLWMVSIRLVKIGSSINFVLTGILILIWFLMTYLMDGAYTAKLNIWTYSILTIGVFQLLIEYRYKISNSVTIESLLRKFKKYG